MDIQANNFIQTLDDTFIAFIIDYKGNLDNHLRFVEFPYNNSYHSTISIASFEALYGFRCISLIGFFEVGNSSIFNPKLIYKSLDNVHMVRNQLKISIAGKILLSTIGERT